MCMTNWSSSGPSALRHNHGSPRAYPDYLGDLFFVPRCTSRHKRTWPYVVTLLSLELEFPNNPILGEGGRSSEPKRALQLLLLGSRNPWSTKVLPSNGEKCGHVVTEEGADLQRQKAAIQQTGPPSAPKLEVGNTIIEFAGLAEFPVHSTKIRNSQKIHRHKTLEFLRGQHPCREKRPSVRNFHRCGPAVDEVIFALQEKMHTNGGVDAVMEQYHGISKADMSGILTEFQLRHNWRGALQFFKWMKNQPWYFPNSRQYTRLIGFLGREGKVDLACTHFQEMLLEKCKPDQYTFTAMVNAYGKAKMYDEAVSVFSYMKTARDENCRPTTVTCNALVDSLVKGGKYDLAFKIFVDMKEGKDGLDFRCRPNVVTYNILIDALCREGHVQAAVQVIYRMSEGYENHETEPNISTYNTLINACGKSGLHDRAEELLEHMTQHGHVPDQITYTALMDAYGKAGKWESAENMFLGMRSSQIQVDVMACTAMIDAYARAGHHNKAEDLFKAMRESGIHPNQITYLALMEAYGKSGLPLAAQEVFVSMEKEGCQANVLHYSALINAYGKVNLFTEAANMYEKMKASGCQPSLVTVSAVLASMTKCNSWNDAKVLLQCLQGSELETALYNLLMPEENLWEPAVQTLEMVRESKQLRQSLYNALMDLLWHFDMKARAAKIVILAKQHGMYTNEYFQEEWNVDLHGLSVGGAMVALLNWLNELYVAWFWGEDVPARVRVITGKGKHSRAKTSALKLPVEDLLLGLDSPFVSTEEDYRGFFVASGNSVRTWLSNPGVKQKLQFTH